MTARVYQKAKNILPTGYDQAPATCLIVSNVN